MLQRRVTTLFVLVLTCLVPHASRADEGRQSYACPIDGELTFPVGNDGKTAPRMFSDLEVPSQAYTNLVVACPKCGYAAWTGDFSEPTDAATVAWVRANLAATAKRAGTDPLFAWQHHVQLLEWKKAPLRERLGALLFWSYVQKRRRPHGGGDATVEAPLQAIRQRVIALLLEALQRDPPKSERARLEWLYLAGELTRLVGEPKKAQPLLAEVCKQREGAGFTVGRFACEQADRAGRGETFEEYRDGMIDPVATLRAAQQRKTQSETGSEAAKPAAPAPPTPPTDEAPPPPPPPAANKQG